MSDIVLPPEYAMSGYGSAPGGSAPPPYGSAYPPVPSGPGVRIPYPPSGTAQLPANYPVPATSSQPLRQPVPPADNNASSVATYSVKIESKHRLEPCAKPATLLPVVADVRCNVDLSLEDEIIAANEISTDASAGTSGALLGFDQLALGSQGGGGNANRTVHIPSIDCTDARVAAFVERGQAKRLQTDEAAVRLALCKYSEHDVASVEKLCQDLKNVEEVSSGTTSRLLAAQMLLTGQSADDIFARMFAR